MRCRLRLARPPREGDVSKGRAVELRQKGRRRPPQTPLQSTAPVDGAVASGAEALDERLRLFKQADDVAQRDVLAQPCQYRAAAAARVS